MIGNVLPALYKPTSLGKFILDLAFRDCALILSNSKLLVSDKASGLAIPAPLVGFAYETPENLQIANYAYCEYPYLNKTMIINALVKNNTTIKIKAYRPILRTSPIMLNVISNYAIIKQLDLYVMRGGTFTLTTMWGVFNDLVLEDLSGIPTEQGVGGVAWDFTFKKVNFDTSSANAVANKLSKLASGGI